MVEVIRRVYSGIVVMSYEMQIGYRVYAETFLSLKARKQML